MAKNKLKIIPLGGLGEIGKNMTVFEYGADMIVVDCGLCFPDDDMPGIDLVIPDMEYLSQSKARLRGFCITHGHEDHIGALPYALRKFNVPVYGTALTLAIVQHKLEEEHMPSDMLKPIKPGDTINLGCFRVEFIKINHSIAGAVAMAITTPMGVVIHTGDFKVDYTPIDGESIDIQRLAHYGTRGVLALMSDSTNVETPGHTESEREIGKTFEHYFDIAGGRVIVATFASNIYRIQQIADVAIAHGRVICLQGRSMLTIAELATQLGYLNIPKDKLVEVDKLNKIPRDKICVITTGTQGEPMSGLTRMANASHRLIVGEGDTVIISASAIPGNEVGVARVINQLCRNGAKVVYNRMADVHVTGHAQRDELKMMLMLTKPKYFIPVHGEYRHLCYHADLAEEVGIPRENIFVMDAGDVLEINKDGARLGEPVPTGAIMVDGSGVGDIGSVVLKDRKLLSEDGLFTAIMVLDRKTGALLAPPEVLSRGFVYVKDSEELIRGAKALVADIAGQFEHSHRSEWAGIKNNLRTTLRNYLYKETGRRPMLLPITIDIDTERK